MKLRLIIWKTSLIVIWTICFATGCVPSATPTPDYLEISIQPVNMLTPTTLLVSPMPAQTKQPSPTVIQITTPTTTPTSQPTFTPRPTATPSLTPLPTLSPGEGEVLVMGLLQNNADCRLPCWWGLMPGQTSWGDAQNFLGTFASKIAKTGQLDRPLYTVYIPVPEEIHPGSRLIHEYRVQDGVIEMIEVGLGTNFQNYALPEFLTNYGQPEEIWIRTFEKSRDNTLPFYVVLFYPQQGIMIRYFDNAEKESDQIRGCPQQEEYWPLLWLWSPEENMAFVETAAQTVNFGLDEEKAYLPLEEVTGMNVETFYQIFKNPDNQDCIETPADFWPPPV